MDPKPFAAIFLDHLMTCATERMGPDGQLTGMHRAWTMSFLRSWWIHSCVAGADTTWGMGNAAARLLNASSFDMEDPDVSRLDFPPRRPWSDCRPCRGGSWWAWWRCSCTPSSKACWRRRRP